MRKSNKYEKLTKPADYSAMFARAEKVSSVSFVVLCKRRILPEDDFVNTNRAKFRIGCIAGKKIGSAVVRNRAKRLIRNVASEVFQLTDLPYSLDIVIMGRAPILTRPFNMLIKEMRYCLHEIKKKCC